MQTKLARLVGIGGASAGLVIACVAGGCSRAEDPVASFAPLVAMCSDSVDGVPAGAWSCPDAFTTECVLASAPSDSSTIYFVPPAGSGLVCASVDVSVNNAGPFAVGTYTIDIISPGMDAAAEPLCTAALTVVDTTPPAAVEHEVVLWPPNHRMHTITPDDCVTILDGCDGRLHARLDSVRSDEPDDGSGDGDTAGDAVFDAANVSVRGERSGSGDGRVYRIGYSATDALGNEVVGSCTVVVPHDQSGRAAIEGPAAYTLIR